MSAAIERRPVIGVTVGARRSRNGRPQLALNRAYVSAVQAAGAGVMLLPPPAVPSAVLDRLDGILLPGGPDVHPRHYGEEPREWLGEVDDDLDELELSLARDAIQRSLPVLGICRGQQVLNVALGGTLYQDLAREALTDFPHATPPEQPPDLLVHRVDVAPGSRLAAVLGARRDVNSRHHQAARRVAPGLHVTATSAVDGVIEGLESGDGRVVAIQCHPEDLTAHAWARDLFRTFVSTSTQLAGSVVR